MVEGRTSLLRSHLTRTTFPLVRSRLFLYTTYATCGVGGLVYILGRRKAE